MTEDPMKTEQIGMDLPALPPDPEPIPLYNVFRPAPVSRKQQSLIEKELGSCTPKQRDSILRLVHLMKDSISSMLPTEAE